MGSEARGETAGALLAGASRRRSTRSGGGSSRPRRLAFICDLPLYRLDGQLYGLTPLVEQLACWGRLFDELILCCPLLPGTPPADCSPYSFDVSFEPVRAGGGNRLRDKAGLLLRIPGWVVRTRRVARRADAVHLRCPSNIGAVAMFSTWRAARYRCATYAGAWRGFAGESRPSRLQRWLLGRSFDGPVNVFAPEDPRRPWLEPSFSPAFDRATWVAAAPHAAAVRQRVGAVDRRGPWRLIVVGRLTPNKNQILAVDATAALVEAGLDVTLDVVGEGPEELRLRARAEVLGIGDRVRFHGAEDHETALQSFRSADLHLLPTRGEGYGKVALEGMLVGVVPVLAPSAAAGSIAGDGCRGLVVSDLSTRAFGDAVASLIADRQRWTSMSDAARAYAGTHTFEAFEAHLRSVLECHWQVDLGEMPAAVGR